MHLSTAGVYCIDRGIIIGVVAAAAAAKGEMFSDQPDAASSV